MAERNPSKQKRAAREQGAARGAGGSPGPGGCAEAGDSAREQGRDRRRSRGRRGDGRAHPSSVAVQGGAGEDRDGPSEPGRAGPPRGDEPDHLVVGTRSDHPVGPTGEGDRPRPSGRAGVRGLIAHLQQIAGGKAVLFAGVFAVVAAGMLLFAPVVPRQVVEAPSDIIETTVAQQEGKPAPSEDDDPDPQTDQVTLLEAAGPLGVLLAGVPVVICGVAIEGSRRPGRRRLYTIAAFALGIYVAFFSVVGIFFFFSMAGLFVAAYQARKADPPVPRTRRGEPSDDDADEDS